MPPTQDAAYGSRSWADQLFAGTETDPWGHDWRASQLARYQAALGLLRQHVAPDKVGSLLDIGCALGHFTRQLSQSFAPARVLGVDISPQAVAKCRRLHPDMDFAESALPQMPLPREGFDLVCALEVIYYVGAENIAASLERIKGVMKPGGWLLVSTYLNKPPFNTAKAFEQALAPHFRIMETALRHHGLYNQFEGLARQAMGKWLEVKQLGVPGAAEQVDRFVGAGVELLGNLDLMEALNRYGAAKMPEQSLSHAIVVARRDG
jgi:SAM-dependent methyltransferase